MNNLEQSFQNAVSDLRRIGTIEDINDSVREHHSVFLQRNCGDSPDGYTSPMHIWQCEWYQAIHNPHQVEESGFLIRRRKRDMVQSGWQILFSAYDWHRPTQFLLDTGIRVYHDKTVLRYVREYDRWLNVFEAVLYDDVFENLAVMARLAGKI